MLSLSTCLKFYKQEAVQKALVKHALDKEVGMRYGGSFGHRPDILSYPRDVLELAKQGVTSFHTSEERWIDPLSLRGELTKKDLEGMRKGWDLVLDIDCLAFEYSRICAHLVIQFLAHCHVKAVTVKFSGNKGFHIGVPFEAFGPTIDDQPTHLQFPEAAQKIAQYVTDRIAPQLAKEILAYEFGDLETIKRKVAVDDIITDGALDLKKFIEIDSVLITSRHLYRMPYSLHEKSGLVSVPIMLEDVPFFEKEMAHPDYVKVVHEFMPRDVAVSADHLVLQAGDHAAKYQREEEPTKSFADITITSPIKEICFPPCMQHLLKGMDDGKKRGLFCLMNFLGKIGWQKVEISDFIKAWNAKNPERLRQAYLHGQLSSFVPGAKLPPNCDNEAYYKGIGICHPDSLCGKIKNPVNYAVVRWRRQEEDKK